jgi:myo-inositol 2-dehydrogenase/D-chiro-inositol 1-dehydrogenase
VAVIGAGHMGERHARAWHALGARVFAVHDPDAARAAALAAEVGAEPATELLPALDHPGVEVVSVCTPTSLHADASVAALQAGRHVLCEKPVALTLLDAERMCSAAAASGRLLRVGFLRRFESSSRRVFELAPALGQPLMVQATLTAGIRPKRLMHDADANGGPVVDMCCHLFDQWARLFGEPPERLSAHGAVLASKRPELAGIRHQAIDSAQITLSYPSGGLAHIFVSWGLPPGLEARETHSYLGPDGLLEVEWPRRLALHTVEGSSEERPPALDPLPPQVEAFLRELRGESHGPVATLEDGIEALRLSLSALASIERGGEAIVIERPEPPSVEGP